MDLSRLPVRSRILFASKTAGSTGPTTSLGLLMDGLSQDHDVSVLLPGEGPFAERLEERGVPVRTVPSLGRRSIPGLARLLRKEDVHLLYVNETSRASRHVCIAAMVAGVPFVSHVRSMGWEHGWRRLGHLRGARAVVAVSQACGDSVARFVPRGRLHVVHNGLPVHALRNGDSPPKPEVRAELGVPPTAPLVMVVGHLTPRKGQLFAIEALETLLKTVPDAHLCLLGAEDRDLRYVARVREAAAREGVEGRVKVLGFRSDVDRLLPAADVFLHVALADPHPRAVLEAMGVGLPVVGFRTDGVAETVVDGETGYLVPSEDSGAAASALVRILQDPDRARRMGRMGRARVEKEFSHTRNARRIREVVEGVLLETRGAA